MTNLQAYRLLPYDRLEAMKCPTVQRFVHILNLKAHLGMTALLLRSRAGVMGPQRTTVINNIQDYRKDNKQATFCTCILFKLKLKLYPYGVQYVGEGNKSVIN